MARARARAIVLTLAAGLASAGAVHADRTEPELTGEQIYSRVLDNRFRSFTEESRMVSGDRDGRVQETRLGITFKDFRDAEGRPLRGIVSKTLVRYTEPFDLRHSAYLMIQNRGRIDDHFVYLPARRRTMRVNLRGEAVFGTDFAFEDVIPRDLEDATYVRLDDSSVDDASVYLVEARPTALFDSEYSKFWFYIDKRRLVPLRVRYWDKSGVEVKELRTRALDIQDYGGVHVPMRITMRNLQLESFTTLEVLHLVANPDLPDEIFELRRLESH